MKKLVLLVMVFVLSFAGVSFSDQKAIDLVKSTKLFDQKQQVGEAFGSFFVDPQWTYSIGKRNAKTVTFVGKMPYDWEGHDMYLLAEGSPFTMVVSVNNELTRYRVESVKVVFSGKIKVQGQSISIPGAAADFTITSEEYELHRIGIKWSELIEGIYGTF